MNLSFLQASTSDALTINGISRRAFNSDVKVGATAPMGPPEYMSVPFHTKMAKAKHLYKLMCNGLIVGGAIVFLDGNKLNIGRIFVDPEHHRKGYGLYIMQEIEALYPDVVEYTLDTPIWNVRTNSFYRKLGYEEIKRDDEFVYYKKSV